MAKIEVCSFIMCSLIFLGTFVQTLPVEDLDLEIMTRLESEGNTLDSDGTTTSELPGWGWAPAEHREMGSFEETIMMEVVNGYAGNPPVSHSVSLLSNDDSPLLDMTSGIRSDISEIEVMQ